MENKGSNPLGNMGGKQAFGFGLVAGFLVLCAIGFFILLGIVLNGGKVSSDKPDKKVGTEDASGPKKFSECLDTGKYANVVKADIQLGSSLGVGGTPGSIINGYALSGALPYAALTDIVDDLLAGNEPFIDDYEQYGMETGALEKVGEPTLTDPVWLGNEKATVSFVEFSDFECPFCSRFADSVKQLLASHGDKIKFTYRHFPLSFHSQAQKAAEAYECAKEQGKAYEMHDELFTLAEAGTLSVANFKKAAMELGLK